jgi:phosphatidylglycerophosphatase C
MDERIPAALFDFDGTLTTQDSFRGLLRLAWRRQPWRFALAMVLFPLLALTVPLGIDRRYVKSWLLWSITVGKGHRRALLDLRSWSRTLAQGDFFWREDAVARYRIHQSAGQKVIVCTASASEWVTEMLESAGLPIDVVVASPIGYRWGGLVWVGTNCYAAEKTMYLERWMRVARSPRLGFVAAYSDHPSDAPLLNLADLAWVVLRHEGDRLRFQKALGVPWKTLSDERDPH